MSPARAREYCRSVINSAGVAATVFASLSQAPAFFQTSGASIVMNGSLNQSGGPVNLVMNLDPSKSLSLTLGGTQPNNYGGYTNVSKGTLVVAKPDNTIAVPGSLYIGAGATVRMTTGSNQISPSFPVNIDSTLGVSTLDLNGKNNSFAGLNFLLGGTAHQHGRCRHCIGRYNYPDWPGQFRR